IGGQVNIGVDVLTGSIAQIKAGKLRALAMLGKTRCEFLPDVPAVGETLSGYEANSWCGLGVPKGTPQEIVERINREINIGLRDATVKARLAQIATTPIF